MRWDLWRPRHRTDMGTRCRRCTTWLIGAGLALALAFVSLGAHPSMVQAARPVSADLKVTMTTPSPDPFVVRSDTITTSEPDYDDLDPLDESMTNPDVDIP